MHYGNIKKDYRNGLRIKDTERVAKSFESRMKMTVDYYTPRNIPPEIDAYSTEAHQPRVSYSGKVGILRLKFERDTDTEKTVIREQYCRVPLCIQRAMYLEESLPAMAYVYIVSPSGGILQGDRYRIDITLGNSAFAHITTQGATRIYKMEKNYATQMISIKVGDGSYFEYLPDQIIPFHNSRFYQEVELTVHDNATMLYSEMIVPGRVESGEAFEYDICYIKTIAQTHLRKSRFVDIMKLEPKKEDLIVEGILGKFQVVGTVYIITRELYVKGLKHEIIEKINEYEDNISGGVSILPTRQGIVVRILGNTAG
ncbi:MAG TPA: urease accessory protein UreD, partial [Nitrososphaeraceae archaeon]